MDNEELEQFKEMLGKLKSSIDDIYKRWDKQAEEEVITQKEYPDSKMG